MLRYEQDGVEEDRRYEYEIDGVERNVSKFDVCLGCEEGDDEMVFDFEYSWDLFERERICRLMEEFVDRVQVMIEDFKRG
uniref:hypothetical protein n=1 Tax=Bacillus thuringiensis TaxID=1428 RepID=UPI0011A0B599